MYSLGLRIPVHRIVQLVVRTAALFTLCVCVCVCVCVVLEMALDKRLDSQQISVGKAGGTFKLVLGGVLSAPTNAFSKRSIITCAPVPGHLRYRYEPTLGCVE